MNTFIVDLWAAVFWFLSQLSLFRLLALIKKLRTSYAFVDAWVLGHLALSIGLFCASASPKFELWEWIAVAYGFTRMFELIVYQINVLLFDEYRAKRNNKEYAVRGFRRLVILWLHNYIEVIFWFAFAYRNLALDFGLGGATSSRPMLFLSQSLKTMTGIGGNSIPGTTAFANALSTAHSIVGGFMIVVVLARFLALVKPPSTMDD